MTHTSGEGTVETTGTNQGSNSRSIQFRDEIAGLDIKTPVDGDERRFLVIGLVLGAIGIVLIWAGWFGASGESNTAKQIPYLISGGVFGLSLVIGGAALFVRYSLSRYLRFWLVRTIYEDRAQTDRQVEVLERIERALAGGAAPAAAPTPAADARQF